MNTTTISTRLTAAASAAVLTVTFAGCAGAEAGPGADETRSVADAGQGVVRFVPNDNDPRGRHTILESLTAPAAHRLLVRAGADRYVAELLERARPLGNRPALGVRDNQSPSIGR